ncbi:WW domain-binding protein 11 [Copidosoma floridanum]|uniref:WW domain-binding protein 11 n=1 Tax=Copidosoma floridanum TaxID=29053 RepID=UPI0006C999D4|nr:WW domain-binding protein 11 [Copidosoma floridanum]
MGRRSINTTKSGKYMNPTDQARKEARKKELKKNKKQRQLVRAAVLKGKDPSQIIEEMEKIDQMEYNVMQPPPLNEKVLKDKRKKLKETLDRVLKMYAKDDQEKWVELKEQMIQYERRRIELVSYFEAVRHAQQVQIDEIPLPATGNDINRIYPGSLTSQIPLPDMPQPPLHSYPVQSHYLPQHHPLVNIPVPPSILKKTSLYSSMATSNTLPTNREPPGVPPFPPPDLGPSDDEDDDRVKTTHKSKTIRFADDDKTDDDKRDEHESSNKDLEKNKEKELAKNKPTSLQQKMLAMAGQDIDQFMKEMEVVHKKRESERAQDLSARLSLLENDSANGEQDNPTEQPTNEMPNVNIMPPNAPTVQPPMPLMGLPPPPPLMYRPPPPPLHMRIPPPPPPRMGIRLPPGPPPGMPRMMRPGAPMPMPRMMGPQMQMPGLPPPPPMPSNMMANAQKTPNVLSAAPQLINARKNKDAAGKSSTTIEAKPQIRNLAADVTRFLPTSLRVKRGDEKKKPSATPSALPTRMPERIPSVSAVSAAVTAAAMAAAAAAAAENQNAAKAVPQVKTKDDAYLQFMQEMQGLL